MGEMPEERYELVDKIGKGGSAVVYKAWNKALKCYVAVKICDNKQDFQIKEREVLKELRHPALPMLLDYMETKESMYLVMEYIEGLNLEEYIEQYGPIEEEQAISWAVEIAEVLLFLHTRGEPVIYQDMKPSNVMIDTDGKIRLIDFGSAFHKHQENQEEYICMGTYGYAAPEQFEKRAWECVDERSDIYALGATLHHMLTGNNPSKPPFIQGPIRSYNGALSGELEKIVKKASMIQKDRRFSNMLEMKNALKRAGRRESISRKLYRTAAAAWYVFLFILTAIFIKECQGGFRRENEELYLITAGFLFILYLGKLVGRKINKKRRIRQVKNIYLSIKKGRGLFTAVGCGVLSAMLLSLTGAASARESVLPVVVRNEQGQKILIRFNSVYCLRESMQLEIPAANFIPGEEYILRLECIRKETKEKKSRTFYLKGPES